MEAPSGGTEKISWKWIAVGVAAIVVVGVVAATIVFRVPGPLVADFSFSPARPMVGEIVNFSATAAGGTPPYSFSWAYGDGAIGTGTNVSHPYASAETFVVTVRVADSASPSRIANVPKSIVVTARLTADFTFSPTNPSAGEPVTFEGSATGGTPPYDHRWTFDDGGTDTGSTVSHTYSSAGSYLVAAIASDAAGHVNTTAKIITISEAPTTTCIPSGDQHDINAKLRGYGDIAMLCAGAVFELTAPVIFGASGQKVYTEGFPTDDRRAVLRLVSGSGSSAVFMLDRSNVVLSNVIVDGNRPNLGPLEGDALILAGGSAMGQVIREVQALETRSWSTIHFFEGGFPRCTGARVENSQIGPAGWTDGSWADGISLACTNSVVRNNTIIDATDGGIVIFGAPGSLVEGNLIRAESRTLLGGINMVDFGPYDGDFRGTRVRGNVIDAAGAVIRIGMGMGSRVWWCLDPDDPTDYTLFGAVVTENILRGEHMQYGFAVDGVREWTVTNNADLATHSGTPTLDCRGRVASPPAGFQYYSARASGIFQPEFTEADLELALWAIEEPRP